MLPLPVVLRGGAEMKSQCGRSLDKMTDTTLDIITILLFNLLGRHQVPQD